MSKQPISRFPVPELKDVPTDIKEKILAVQTKTGFVPNVFLAMAARPDECRAFFMQHDTLMHKESGLSKGEREMIAPGKYGEYSTERRILWNGEVVISGEFLVVSGVLLATVEFLN